MQVGDEVVGRDAAPAEREAVDIAESAWANRSIRADAVRNRERLLVAAAVAFAEHGAEVPLEDVARSAGVGIGTLYRHFPTRGALVEAVYRHEVDVLCERADELLATLPADEALASWMHLFVRHVATKRGMLSVLKPMMSANASLVTETRGRAVDAASRLLAAGVAAGTVRADIEGADLIRAVGGICMSTDQERSDASDRLVGLLVDGLRHSTTAAAASSTAPVRTAPTG